MKKYSFYILVSVLCIDSVVNAQQKQKNNFEDWSDKPVVITPGLKGKAPSDAIVLFSKNNLDQWKSIKGEENPATWKVTGRKFTIVPGTGDIITRRTFGDCQLHVEWKIPANEQQESLNWGNSGVYLMGLYEVQIYSSYMDEHPIYFNGQAGSIYKQYKPLVNVSKPAGKWQSFDIIFTAPRFNSDQTLKSPAYVTVFHNNVLIQNQVTLKGPTTHGDYTEYTAHPEKLPLFLQEHGSRVSFRNLWIREL
ncbi:MAG TPA: DUF1080 domain-containing protein [Bacteroidales bacterium]|nr:DUF1080 domain-containing protein [Bacteroidales bacterium]